MFALHSLSKNHSSLQLFIFALAGMILFQTCSSSKETITEEPVIVGEGIDQESILNNVSDTTADSMLVDSLTIPADTVQHQTGDSVNIEALLQKMTLREKIGQLFFVWASGYYTSTDDPSYRELVSKIKNLHLGGLIFSRGTVYGQAVLYNKLQQVSEIPLWITQDMEYGAAMRIEGATRFPPAMGVAATGNPDYAYWMGKITAREAKAVGVNQIFAPVLDVNNNPNNPVINVRSFSGNPQTVATFGNRFIDGVASENLIATAKHFPGHGDTDTDSHLALPIVGYGYSRLDTVELVPFRKAIDNGIESIMTAHIAFPEISSYPGLPATMDDSILDRILLDSLNFNGVVVTDGLEMSGISSNYAPGDAVIRALKAGVDMMLLSSDERTAIHRIERAVERGHVSEERIDYSVRKILAWKKEFGLFDKSRIDITKISQLVNTREHQLIADEISRRSLTLVRNKHNILPIRASRFPKLLVISVADDESGNTGSYFAQQIREYHPDVMFHVFDKRSSEEEQQKILRDARKADLIVIGSFIYVRSGQKVQLSSDQLELLNNLPAGKPSVLVAFGNPYIVRDLPDSEVQLMAWAANTGQVRNTVPALFGGSHINGRLPIEIPGMYAMGHGIDLPQTTIRFDAPETVGLSLDSLQRVDQIMYQAIFDSTFPGGTVAVVKDGVIAYSKAYGYHTYDKLKKVQFSDVYDLASLTKVVATTTSVMKLISEGKIDLDDKVSEYIPEFKQGEKSAVTIRHLLLHNSGLPAFRVYVDRIQDPAVLMQAIKEEPLINKPGEKYVYSDLGFILLGEIVKQVSGRSLDSYVRRELYYPMGMSSSFFNPARVGTWYSRRIPPTEIDTVFRDQLVQGVVHDERAYYLDGVAGHAGLFSNAYDLAVWAQMLMNEGAYGGVQFLEPDIVRKFVRRQSDTSTRALGFDTKSEGFSSAGQLTSSTTFGHTGFTGTSVWIDPERNLAIILLTNRVHPYRSYGEDISQIRARVADAVISSIFTE
jgi:beta-glucosidase-like glycosyl hydrolase/CubicO group peptidase (beta-lactamase class C family)